MKRTIHRIGFVVSGLFILYIIFIFFTFSVFSHHFSHDYSKYMWIFKDSVKSEIDTFLYSGYQKKNDDLNFYLFKNEYHIIIWEFKNTNINSLQDCQINPNANLKDIKFKRGERLNGKSLISPMINLKFIYNFSNVININIDNQSRILNSILSDNVKGFYGVINKMSFSNEKGKHLIMLEYSSKSEPTLLIVYLTGKSVFVIIINSKQQFESNIVEILNLS